jgi:hypothetical protein
MFPLEMSIIEVEYHCYLLKALQIVYFKKAKFVLSESAKRFLKFALGCIRQAALGLVVARVPLLLAPSWPFFFQTFWAPPTPGGPTSFRLPVKFQFTYYLWEELIIKRYTHFTTFECLDKAFTLT